MACTFALLRDLINDLDGFSGELELILLPNAYGVILKLALDWAEHHLDDLDELEEENVDDDEYRERPLEEWDQQNLDVSNETCSLITST